MTPEELSEIRIELIYAMQDVVRLGRKLDDLAERLTPPGAPPLVMTDPIQFEELGAKFQEAQRQLKP